MIAGHSFLAFSLAASLAYILGRDPEECLYIGLFAGMFALLPDVDILFAWKEILVLFTSGLSGFVEAFWTASRTFHRGISHSLVTLSLGVIGFSLCHRVSERYLALTVFIALTLYGFGISGVLAGLVVSIFAFLGTMLSYYSDVYLDSREFLLCSTIGLLTHPFGDVFTGTPPDFFFPFSLKLLESRILLNPYPVLNLISIFLLELLLVAAGLIVFARLRSLRPFELLHPLSLLGFLYFLFYFFIPEPTLSVSYRFVFSVLVFGVLNTALLYMIKYNNLEKVGEEEAILLSLNLVLTVIFAVLGYTAAYLVF